MGRLAARIGTFLQPRIAALDLLGGYLRAVYRHWNDYFFYEMLIAPIIAWWMLGSPPVWLVAGACVWALLVAGYFTWRADHIHLIPKLRLATPAFRLHDTSTTDRK
jgi:hypothetical protein